MDAHIKWFNEGIRAEEINGRVVLEVGSHIINFGLKHYLIDRGFKDFIFKGIDVVGGPGVDEIVDICKVVYRKQYDAIFSITTLEHVADWRVAIQNMKDSLKVGGYMWHIVPSLWPAHQFPIDKWRYSLENIKDIFADYEMITIDTFVHIKGTHECIVFKCKKLTDKSIDLNKLEVRRI